MDTETMELLRGKVAEAKGTMASAKTLITGLKDRLTAALNTQDQQSNNTALAEEVRAIIADLDSGEDGLAAAVAENA